MTSLKIGMDILAEEHVQIDKLLGHGGYFKTPVAGQTILSAALKAPISVMETAGEGGPWGMALLAAYRVNRQADETLEDYLNARVFAGAKGSTIRADAADEAGLDAYTARFHQALFRRKGRDCGYGLRRGIPMLKSLKEAVYEANMELPEASSGNEYTRQRVRHQPRKGAGRHQAVGRGVRRAVPRQAGRA